MQSSNTAGSILPASLRLATIERGKQVRASAVGCGHESDAYTGAKLYASAGRWSDLAQTGQLITDRQMHKTPGCSRIEPKNEVHLLLACDRPHNRANEVYAILSNLTFQASLVQDK